MDSPECQGQEGKGDGREALREIPVPSMAAVHGTPTLEQVEFGKLPGDQHPPAHHFKPLSADLQRTLPLSVDTAKCCTWALQTLDTLRYYNYSETW